MAAVFGVSDASRRGEVSAEEATSFDGPIVELFDTEARNLVRLARFFVDDRNAAEDLVQEAFIRLAGSWRRIDDLERAPAYLRSIVLNLARDHNRRGLVSLRHRLPEGNTPISVEEVIEVREDQRQVIEALGRLPLRQRNALVLRYYLELPIPEIAATMGVSANTVKTHLTRGLRRLEELLGEPT